MWIVLGVVLLVLAVVLLVLRKREIEKLGLMRATQTCSARELQALSSGLRAAMGEGGLIAQLAEVKGAIRCAEPLTSEIAAAPCVYYRMQVTRRYEETYWATERDAQGHARRVRRTRAGSEVVAANDRRVLFQVEDATGQVTVDPADAELDAEKVADRFAPESAGIGGQLVLGGLNILLGGMGMQDRRTLGYQVEEWILPLDRQAYILGAAADTPHGVTIRHPGKAGRFLISLRSEEQLQRGAARAALWLTLGALVAALLGIAAFAAHVALPMLHR